MKLWRAAAVALVACSGNIGTSDPDSGMGGGNAGTGGGSAGGSGGGDVDAGGFDAGTRPQPDAPWTVMNVAHPLGVWVKQSPVAGKPSPGFLYEGGGAWDPYTKRFLHFGGHDGIPQGHHLFDFELLTNTWRQRFAPSSPPGACLVEGGMAFDTSSRKLARFSAASLNHGYHFSREIKLKRGWVWLYDPVSGEWANMRPTPYASGTDGFPAGSAAPSQAATFDNRRSLIYTHGGISAPGDRLTVYDAWDNSIEQLTVAANAPTPRDDHGFAYDALDDVLLVFGAQYSADPTLYVFRFATQTWEKKTPATTPPVAITGSYSAMPRLACDGATHTCLLIGRDSATGNLFTSLLDTTTWSWTTVTTPQPQSLKTRAFNLVYAPDVNLYVLELQTTSASGDVEEIWTFRVDASARSPNPGPPPSLTVETTASSAKLEWLPSAEATAYRVYRAVGGRMRTAALTFLAETTDPHYEDLALASGVNVFYEVRSKDGQGRESDYGPRARAQPRVLPAPGVTLTSAQAAHITFTPNPGSDVVGFNVYRGRAAVAVTDGGEPLVSAYNYNNDLPYPSPRVIAVTNVVGLTKLNGTPITATAYDDLTLDVATPNAESDRYPFAVYAYVVRAVNALGVESGPSPYTLTLPSEPRQLMIDDRTADAVLTWQAPREGAVAYRVYEVPGSGQVIDRTPDAGLTATSFTVRTPGQGTRFSVTAFDALGQEGTPASLVWFKRSYPGFFTGPLHQ